ncbi:MAG: hypothetical protein R2879_00425 [Saprospiraceae bacterium]
MKNNFGDLKPSEKLQKRYSSTLFFKKSNQIKELVRNSLTPVSTIDSISKELFKAHLINSSEVIENLGKGYEEILGTVTINMNSPLSEIIDKIIVLV